MVSLSLLLESSFRTISLSLLSESSLITSWNHLVEFEIWNSDSKRRILIRIPFAFLHNGQTDHWKAINLPPFEAYKSKYWAERARMSKNTSLCVPYRLFPNEHQQGMNVILLKSYFECNTLHATLCIYFRLPLNVGHWSREGDARSIAEIICLFRHALRCDRCGGFISFTVIQSTSPVLSCWR